MFFNRLPEWPESGTGPLNNGCQIAYAKKIKWGLCNQDLGRIQYNEEIEKKVLKQQYNLTSWC